MTDSAPERNLKPRHRSTPAGSAAQSLLVAGALTVAMVWLVPAGYLHVSFGKADPVRPKGPVAARSPVGAGVSPKAPFDTWDNPNVIPVGYDADNGKSQMVAEVFRAPPTWTSLTAVVPYISWSLGPVKSRLYLDVYSLTDPRDPVAGRLIAERSVPVFDLPSGKYFPMTFDYPILLEPGRYYSLRFSVRDPAALVGVGMVDRGVQYPNSRLWVYGYLYGPNGGQPLSPQRQWILTRADLVFQLSFGEDGSL